MVLYFANLEIHLDQSQHSHYLSQLLCVLRSKVRHTHFLNKKLRVGLSTESFLAFVISTSQSF